MKPKRILAVVAALCMLAAPAVAFAATTGQPDSSAAADTGAHSDAQARAAAHQRARAAVHKRAAARNVRLARTLAHRTGRHFPSSYERHARLRATDALQRSNARLRRTLDRMAARHRAARAVIASVGRGVLARIARCESHGNPRAIGGGGTYRGAYQFDYRTWRSVGGHGDPAQAPMREQTRRAALLYKRVGWSAWPVCGR